MRRRMIVGVMGVLTASALVIGTSATAGAASVSAGGKPPVCKGKTKKKAIKEIKEAWFHFLDGASNPDPIADKEPFIQFMSGDEVSPAFQAQFEASAAANAAQAATTSVQVNKVKCTGKKSADVDFDLVINGDPLPDLAPAGDAVLDADGVWKVSGQTLCNTQALGSPAILEAGPCYEILIEGEPADLTSG